MTATITNHLGQSLTGEVKCWMGRRIVEVENLRRCPAHRPSPNPPPARAVWWTAASVHCGRCQVTEPLTPTRQRQAGTVTGPLVAAIEQTWAAIQARHRDVPDVVLTLGNGSTRPGQLTLGHFHARKWASGDARLPELFIGGEGLAAGPRDLLGTLLHEAVHGVAATRGIKDTSRQGRYHNARYRELATEHGITVARDPRIGWSLTTVPDTTPSSTATRSPRWARR